jgi:peroxin-11B
LYLSKAETRDKICRAIQYGSKAISGGQPGIAQGIEKNTSQARKVFRLAKFLNDLQVLLTPPAKDSPLPIVLLTKIKHALLFGYFSLDSVVWFGRSNIYKNKEKTELLSKASLYCWTVSTVVSAIIEIAEISRISAKERGKGVIDEAERAADAEKIKTKMISLIRSNLDTVVGIGLVGLAPETVTPRVTGSLGLITSLIACYQQFPAQPAKAKAA